MKHNTNVIDWAAVKRIITEDRGRTLIDVSLELGHAEQYIYQMSTRGGRLSDETTTALAEILGVPEDDIVLERNFKPSWMVKPVVCKMCGKAFARTSPRQKFCRECTARKAELIKAKKIDPNVGITGTFRIENIENPADMLTAGIIKRAVDDWKTAKHTIAMIEYCGENYFRPGELSEAKGIVKDCERFFASEWLELLLANYEITGAGVLRMAAEEFEAERAEMIREREGRLPDYCEQDEV